VDAEDLFGLQARLADRTRFGRITEVFFDEETGEVSYVVVGRGRRASRCLSLVVNLDAHRPYN
jgi:uncharacterized protein YrrD